MIKRVTQKGGSLTELLLLFLIVTGLRGREKMLKKKAVKESEKGGEGRKRAGTREEENHVL